MRIDFNQIQEMTMPCLHGGPGEMSARFFGGEGGKRGSEHSIQNTGEGDLVLLTVVVERENGREKDT